MTSANPAENRPLHSEPKASTGKEALDVFIKQLSDPHLRSYAEIDALFHEAKAHLGRLEAENAGLREELAVFRLPQEQRERLESLPELAFVTEDDLTWCIDLGFLAIIQTREFKRGVISNVYELTPAGLHARQVLGAFHDQ